jgi:hypothetical protein
VLSSSSDGTKLLAGFINFENPYGGLYTSTDSGATWIVSNTITNDCLSIASSADGTKLIVMTRSSPSPGGFIGSIYSSTNSGTTWNQNHSNTLLNLVASSDGTKAVMAIGFGGGIVGNGGGMVVTTNSGATWLSTGAPGAAWSSIATSADGGRFVAVIGGQTWVPTITGSIYTSADSGATWTIADAPTNNCWTSVASSADGCKLVAVSTYVLGSGTEPRGGSIYTVQTTPTPVLNIRPSGDNVVLSWTVPSMNFVLRRTSDLAAGTWTESGVTPALNSSTLQFEVTLPKPQGLTFYRLISQ